MKILIVSATSLEIQPFINYLDEIKARDKEGGKTEIPNFAEVLVTGVGAVNTVFALTTFPDLKSFDLVVNAGIAGVYGNKYPLGSVVNVITDQFGDVGVEYPDQSFHSIFELELDDANRFPFTNEKIINPYPSILTSLPNVSSLSFNMVSGSEATVRQRAMLNADIESMEGAAFAYTMSSLHRPYLQIRSISNDVEPRDKSKWKMKEALNNLNDTLIQLIQTINMT